MSGDGVGVRERESDISNAVILGESAAGFSSVNRTTNMRDYETVHNVSFCDLPNYP